MHSFQQCCGSSMLRVSKKKHARFYHNLDNTACLRYCIGYDHITVLISYMFVIGCYRNMFLG